MGRINVNEFDLIVRGCPVADGGPSCCHGCGGGWPGTRITTEAITQAVVDGKVVPDKLGCQPLVDRAAAGLQEWATFTQSVSG